jgi:methionine-rich copper-binding protein CopC
VAILAAVLALLAASVPAGAHTDLLQSSPGPSSSVGGTVDFIDLVFVDPVRNVQIELVGPDGMPIDGEIQVGDGQIIRYRMPALELVGTYTVSYTMASADGDETVGGFAFGYDPAAREPFRLGELDLPSNTGRNVRLVLGAIAGLALIVSILVMLARLERNRAALAAQRRPDGP